MVFTYALVFLLSVVATMADHNPCCYPDKFKADVYVSGKLRYTSYVDYTKNKVYEDWGGRVGTAFVVLDLEKNVRYRTSSSGNCRPSHVKSAGTYLQCIPDDAEYEGPNSDGQGETFSFPNGRINVKRTVVGGQGHCLPYKVQRFLGGMAFFMEYKNVETNFNDDIFNVDLKDCQMKTLL